MQNMMALKDKIIRESLKLFSLKGFLSTSIHDIMKETKASKGGLYNHFKSKDDIFFAVLDEAKKDLARTESCRIGSDRKARCKGQETSGKLQGQVFKG